MTLTKTQMRKIRKGVAESENCTVLEALSRAIDGCKGLTEEYDYLKGRAAYHNERSRVMMEKGIGFKMAEADYENEFGEDEQND